MKSVIRNYLSLTIISLILFYLFSYTGFIFGDTLSKFFLYEYFGEPQGFYLILFATVIVLSENILGFLGVIVGFVAMHQIGRRLNISVGKPTLVAFLLYLLTLLVLALY